MKKSIKLAALAAFFAAAALVVIAPTIDAMEAEKQVKAEQIRAASEAAETQLRRVLHVRAAHSS